MLESVRSVSKSQSPTSLQTNGGGTDYKVQRGDTLGEIAARFGTDVKTLQEMNNISNPNKILAGQTISVPTGGKSVTVQRGDTLSDIARANGTTVKALMDANPQIRNANQIYPGNIVNIVGTEASASVRAQGSEKPSAAQPNTVNGAQAVNRTELVGGTLKLSQADVVNIKKTLQTEWYPKTANNIQQAYGIIDTILNRTASGKWGNTVSEVVNARNQFSDINGPISRKNGRDSVEEFPLQRVSAQTSSLVDNYLAARANGTPSSVGTHLNYANPNHSDAKNLPWIMKLDGPVFGRGDAIHRHGTTADLQDDRPQPFAVALPGSGGTTAPAAPKNSATAPAANAPALNGTRIVFSPVNGPINSRDRAGEGDGHFHSSRSGGRLHQGIDINSPVGTPVRAVADGTVIGVINRNVSNDAGARRAGRGEGAGTIVTIQHANGVVSRYFHLQYGSPQFRVGQTVTAGQEIARVGRTGNTPAAGDTHLHFELQLNGRAVDPLRYLPTRP